MSNGDGTFGDRKFLPVTFYDAVLNFYAKHGGDTHSLAQALNNGLNEVENQKLMFCSDAQGIARLVLTGLG